MIGSDNWGKRLAQTLTLAEGTGMTFDQAHTATTALHQGDVATAKDLIPTGKFLGQHRIKKAGEAQRSLDWKDYSDLKF